MTPMIPPQARAWFRRKIPWRNSPLFQNMIAGLVLCLLPGIYLALTGLGAGGGKPTSETVAPYGNVILYGVLACTGWFGGIAMNLIGPKYTMALSAFGYMANTGGLWCFDITGNPGLVYAGGALEGLCGGLLWTSAGAIAYSYAVERQKALYVTIQWICCVYGSTAAIIAHSLSTYTTGSKVLEFRQALTSPSEILRADGQTLANLFDSSPMGEISGIWAILTDRRFILLSPAMFCGEITLAQLSSLNGYHCHLRARSLNNVLFNVVQIPASLGITWLLERDGFRTRRARSLIANSIVGVLALVVCAGEIVWLRERQIDRRKQAPLTDWMDRGFWEASVVYLLYGSVYGTFQMATQYILSSFTNDPLILARYSGAFRGVNALGMMTSFLIDGFGVGYVSQIAFQIAAFGLGIVSLFVVSSKHMTPTNYGTEANVITPEGAEDDTDQGHQFQNMNRARGGEGNNNTDK